MSDSRKGSVDNIAELAKASQAGQRGAFDHLVRLYQRRAMQVAVRILGDANEAAEAEGAGTVRILVVADCDERGNQPGQGGEAKTGKTKTGRRLCRPRE